MRNTFIDSLCQMASDDERIWLLSGDLGFGVLEPFAERYPKRFVNVGVAEQNMAGIAAGLALCGKTVFTYSIANFPVMRCFEQIRNDICYHNLNVNIVAVGGGLAYGSHGYTHHGVEDLAVMSALPGMTVLAPGDPVETRLATRAIAGACGPCYLRLGKANEPVVHSCEPEFEIGRAITVREGTDITLISTGGMLATCVQAADKLMESGIEARVLSMVTVAPIDEVAILDAARETGGIIAVEEHGFGGLGSTVGLILAEAGVGTRYKAMNLGKRIFKTAGSQETLRREAGLSVESICDAATVMAPRKRGGDRLLLHAA